MRDGVRDEPDGVRRPEGPAAGPLRIVDVVERVDLTDPAADFGRGNLSVAVECICNDCGDSIILISVDPEHIRQVVIRFL